MYIRLAHFYLVLLICISPIALQQAQAQTKQVNKQATIQTSLGDIAIELYSQQAPATVANFIAYIKDAAYNGGDFYRVVGPDNDQGTPQISVIQGRTNLHHKDFPHFARNNKVHIPQAPRWNFINGTRRPKYCDSRVFHLCW
ncbi:peptidylprolyl isomerase [Paraglaciecola sp. Hal342]